MNDGSAQTDPSDDEQELNRLGYRQELLRRLSGFSSFAVSFSIICILAGGVTSFHLGLSSVGGASIGLGWPLMCLFSLVVAATMGQVASAFPTAGGLYHWASILGGRGWGWGTAWFNLAGLITVLAAINVGTFQFVMGALGPSIGLNFKELSPASQFALQIASIVLITGSQAVVNHLGIRLTKVLIDASGYLILATTAVLTVSLFASCTQWDWARLATFSNLSGDAGGAIWPRTENVAWLFALGLLLPAYTITGFDASAHTAEETVQAARNVPRGIVQSVLISAVAGWIMLSTAVLAAGDVGSTASRGDGAFLSIVRESLSAPLAWGLLASIGVCQYLCGLATVTSASRMTYAFARDGGLPFSSVLRRVHAGFRSPVPAIWAVALSAVAFTVYTPVYSTITAVCAIFLYISYVVPTILGLAAHGRTWTRMGPWHLGPWYRPLAAVCGLGCVGLIFIGMQPPNEKSVWIVGVSVAVLVLVWFAFERRRFRGPPVGACQSRN
jgi:amino acid transporter